MSYDELNEILDGLLISDGNLAMDAKSKRPNARYRHACKHKEYVNYIKSLLESYNINFTGKQEDKIRSYIYKDRMYHYIQSSCQPILTKSYFRWYNIEGKKILPYNLKITPQMALQWYLGDGSVDRSSKRFYGLQLCTHGFKKDSVDFLSESLKEIGIKNSVKIDKRYDHNIIIIRHRASCFDFLNYIGKCPVECYKYKWDNIPPLIRSRAM